MRKILLAVSFALTIMLAWGRMQAWAKTQVEHAIAPAPARAQIVNGELVLGEQKIRMTQGAAIPGSASLSQKIQAALPAYLSTKFKGPTLMAVPASQASAAGGAKAAQTRMAP